MQFRNRYYFGRMSLLNSREYYFTRGLQVCYYDNNIDTLYEEKSWAKYRQMRDYRHYEIVSL